MLAKAINNYLLISHNKFYLPSRREIRSMLDVPAHASSAVSQYYSHVSVSREMRVSGIAFLLVSVLPVLPDTQAQHFVRQFERLADVILVDDLGFDVDRLVDDWLVTVSTQLRFVRYIRTRRHQRYAQLALYHISSGLSTGRTCIRRRIRNETVAQRRVRR